MSAMAGLSLVDVGDLEEYPISARERLDSHYFMQFNVRRYDDSDFRRKSHRDPEVGFFGFELFFKSHSGSPLGTLPDDDDALAFLLNLSLERWLSLRDRSFNPLYNWSRVQCDNGEVRLAHPVVTEVMISALRGHLEYKASNEDKAVYARRKRLTHTLRQCGCSKDLCEDDVAVAWLDDWLLENHTGQRRMPQIQYSVARAIKAASAEGVLGRPHGNR